MKENELKHLFCDALLSGHIKGNDIIPMKGRIRIIEEAHFGSFDLLIACISSETLVDNYENIVLRIQLLERFAKTEKCRIDRVRFFPVEIKSDSDTLDERLPNQMIDAILTFGLSILVLDKNHSMKARSLAKFLPATIISYTGNEFEVCSKFDRIINAGVFSFDKTGLARLLGDMSGRTLSRLAALQRIIEKLAFNQLYLENPGLSDEELEFLQIVAGMRLPSNGRKMLARLIQETSNMKLTDFN
jgi:hypothetical protein